MKPDPRLIQACLEQDRGAQFELYKLCYPVLMSVCCRYAANGDEPAEMLNQGFLKILNKLESWKTEVPFEAWLRRVMINTAIDHYRKEKKRRETIEYTDFNGWSNEPVDYNEADHRYDAEAIEAMIRELPPTSRQVFNLFAIDGYSHKEVGEMLGISDGTSKWHVANARKLIKSKIRMETQALKRKAL